MLPLVQVMVRDQRMSPWAGFEQGDDGLECMREVRHGLGSFLSWVVLPTLFVRGAAATSSFP